jgi:ATP-dependent DNA ligase
VPTCVYCFDLLELNGRDLREQPLVQRRAQLEALLKRGKCNVIRFSEAFPNANDLLAECTRRDLEGIVCKRKDSSYRSGTRSGWIKVKTSWSGARQTKGGRNSSRNRCGADDQWPMGWLECVGSSVTGPVQRGKEIRG